MTQHPSQPQRSLERVTHEELYDFRVSMDSGGLGVYRFESVISRPLLCALQDEINYPGAIEWRDGSADFVNERGKHITQCFDVYALKLNHGDETPVNRLQQLHNLRVSIQSMVNALIITMYPTVGRWATDEMVLQRYWPGEGELSIHKDNARHPGLIAIASIEGEAEMHVLSTDDSEHTLMTAPGDVVMVRGTNLTDAGRPEHGIANVVSEDVRTSATFRDNVKPDEPIPGFEYDNWSGGVHE